MNFVDEENRPLLGVRQIRDDILRSAHCRAVGNLKINAQFARDAHGESRLSEAWGTVEKDVSQSLAALLRSFDGDRNAFVNFALTDHVKHARRTQRRVVLGRVRQRKRIDVRRFLPRVNGGIVVEIPP